MPAKKFKPAPMLVCKDETSLKIRISRYGTAPGRSQHKTVPQEKNAPAIVDETAVDEETTSPVKMCEVKLSNLTGLKTEKAELEGADSKPHPLPRLNTKMSASELIAECERVGPGNSPISTSLLEDGAPCPSPKRRSQLPKLKESQLLPPTPSVQVRSKQEAFSPQLLEWCLQRPITVIRGLTQVCDMDLSLYTTKTLVESHPNHPVEIRTQHEQSSDENWDPQLKEQVCSNEENKLISTQSANLSDLFFLSFFI